MAFVDRGIRVGDARPRIFIEVEAAVEAAETVSGAVETLHDWIVERLCDWFPADVGLNVSTFVEPTDEGWD